MLKKFKLMDGKRIGARATQDFSALLF